jgi:hypothetical protein
MLRWGLGGPGRAGPPSRAESPNVEEALGTPERERSSRLFHTFVVNVIYFARAWMRVDADGQMRAKPFFS